jgi:N-acetyl-gamma-glutamylphosphate reductase
MPALKRVALVGGTGMLGSTIVQAILSRKDLFELTVFTRIASASKLPDEVNRITVESFEDAEENETLLKGLSGHDVLVSTLNAAVAIQCKLPCFLRLEGLKQADLPCSGAKFGGSSYKSWRPSILPV